MGLRIDEKSTSGCLNCMKPGDETGSNETAEESPGSQTQSQIGRRMGMRTEDGNRVHM